MAPRINVRDAWPRVASGQALLVCAYDDEQKCKDANIVGAITHQQFRAQLGNLPKSREIIFLCG